MLKYYIMTINPTLEETIFFYTRNDYLIINSLFNGNMDDLWKFAEIVNNDSKGVLEEHNKGERNLDEKSLEKYTNRIYEQLDEKTKKKIIETAKKDITNILDTMQPAKNEILVYRSVREKDVLTNINISDIVEFKIISSTSVNPFQQNSPSYSYEYKITIPQGGLILELDQFDKLIRNEDGEILLPPMKCKVKNIKDNIIELEYLEKIPVLL
jgi:hypothetical protein